MKTGSFLLALSLLCSACAGSHASVQAPDTQDAAATAGSEAPAQPQAAPPPGPVEFEVPYQ
jgi:hypothetical protein